MVVVGPLVVAALGVGVVLPRLLVAAAAGIVRAVSAAVALSPSWAAAALWKSVATRAGALLLCRLAAGADAVVASAVVFPRPLLLRRRRGAVAVSGW